MLLELAAGLAPSLDQEAISLLYRAAKPLVRDDAYPHLQKRAYKVSNSLSARYSDACARRAGVFSIVLQPEVTRQRAAASFGRHSLHVF